MGHPARPLTVGLGPVLQRVYTAQREVLLQQRTATAGFDLFGIDSLAWSGMLDQARQVVTLGDLIAPRFGTVRQDVVRASGTLLNTITRVADCLYEGFGRVLPAIRLDWAERVGQYDGPVNLRNLASLPRWGELDLAARRELQADTDWLFAQFDASVPSAVAMVNDLVRVALLLASHAPVNQILAGHVVRNTPIFVGSLVNLVPEVDAARVGMHVLMYSGSDVVAYGQVEDLAPGRAAARVLTTLKGVTAAGGRRARAVRRGCKPGHEPAHLGAATAPWPSPARRAGHDHGARRPGAPGSPPGGRPVGGRPRRHPADRCPAHRQLPLARRRPAGRGASPARRPVRDPTRPPPRSRWPSRPRYDASRPTPSWPTTPPPRPPTPSCSPTSSNR